MQFNYQKKQGCDDSFYQGYPPALPVIDYRKTVEFGLDFVIIRAGQACWEDAAFRYNWPAAKGVIPRHSYWYFDNEYDPKLQARKYAEIMRPDPDGMYWLDLEDRTAGPHWSFDAWYNFFEEFKFQMGIGDDKLGIYTAWWYWNETPRKSTAQVEYFKKYPLWLSNFWPGREFTPPYEAIDVPFPWSECLLLQSGTPVIGLASGVSSLERDYNQFNGDQEKFNRYFSLPGDVSPVGETGENDEKETIMQGKVLRLTNMRASNTQLSADLGDFQEGDIVVIGGEKKMGGDGLYYYPITGATRGGLPVLRADGLIITALKSVWAYATNIELLPEAPVPVNEPIIITHNFDIPGYSVVDVIRNGNEVKTILNKLP